MRNRRRSAVFLLLPLVLVLQPTLGTADEDANPRAVYYREHLRKAMVWLTSEDAGTRLKGLSAVGNTLNWVGSNNYPLMPPDQKWVLGTRATREALRRLAREKIDEVPKRESRIALRALDALSWHTDATRRIVAGVVGELAPLLETGPEFWRRRLLEILGHVGLDADSAVPHIEPLLLSAGADQIQATDTVGSIGGERAKALLHKAITHSSPQVRKIGYRGWGSVEILSGSDAVRLAAGLEDTNLVVREAAGNMLMIKPARLSASPTQAEKLVGLFARHLGSDSSTTRRAACAWLGVLGDRTQFDALRKMMLSDESEFVRTAAARALVGLGPPEKAALALAGALGNEEVPRAQRALIASIRSLRADAIAAVPHLVCRARDEERSGHLELAKRILAAVEYIRGRHAWRERTLRLKEIRR